MSPPPVLTKNESEKNLINSQTSTDLFSTMMIGDSNTMGEDRKNIVNMEISNQKKKIHIRNKSHSISLKQKELEQEILQS